MQRVILCLFPLLLKILLLLELLYACIFRLILETHDI